MSEHTNPIAFSDLNLPDRIVHTLKRINFHTPTPIQAKAIPVGVEGRDLIGIAQTGTGKTMAFGIPIACRLTPGQMALVLAPTRELALQIQDAFAEFGLRTACVIGGAPMHRQVRELRTHPQVIVATPGRLIDLLNQGAATLNRVSIVVLDEADRMFDMGFAPAIKTILEQAPENRQTLMFSATMPDAIRQLANEQLKDPVRIETEKAGSAAEGVEQEVWTVPFEEKHATLEKILYDHDGSALIFTRTRHGARKLAKAVRDLGFTADEIHSDRSLAQRRDALDRFKSGRVRFLVATDIAARGIDVKEIGLVLNFDVPENPEDYIHRIGRTARAGQRGRAITLATPQQHRDVKDIERIMKSAIPKFNAAGAAMASRDGDNARRKPNRTAPDQVRRKFEGNGPVVDERIRHGQHFDHARPERPAFNRDNRGYQGSDRPQSDRPQFDRNRPHGDRPQFDRRDDRPRFDQRDDRPRNDQRNDRPRFDRRDDRPNVNRGPNPADPRPQGRDWKPRGNDDRRPPQGGGRFNDRGPRPDNRFEDRGNRFENDRGPRFNDDRGPRFNDNRGDVRPARNEGDRFNDRPRPEGENRTSQSEGRYGQRGPMKGGRKPVRHGKPSHGSSSPKRRGTPSNASAAKPFRPKKAKSYITQQVVSSGPRRKGPSRMEGVINATRKPKAKKR